MSALTLGLDGTESASVRLVYANDEDGSCGYTPAEFTATVHLSDLSDAPPVDAIQLLIPPCFVSDQPTWRAVRPVDDVIEWRLSAREPPRRFSESIAVVVLSRGREIARFERTVAIELRLTSQFRPSQHVVSRANNVEGWGVVEPNLGAFRRTYSWVPFRSLFFNGLYRGIVFLNGEESNPGGLCTGLARAALERSLTRKLEEPSLAEVVLWHGRQLTDRALLASARWLFFGSPKRAFEAFRDDLFREGVSTRCFDLGVPKPWRRDIIRALQETGHTVVPYAVEQSTADQARVLVYDPNDPEASIRGDNAITFRLHQDDYRYDPLGQTALDRTTVVAVEQSAYREGKTAVLAALASATLNALDRLRSR